MARLFQPVLPAVAAEGAGHPASATPPPDEDLALGWECANPALQFEHWDPAAGVQPTQAAQH